MRLLREIKDRVASRVAQKKYGEVLKDAQKKLWNYAYGIIANAVGDKFLQEVREDANHHFLSEAFSVTFFTKNEINGHAKECKTVPVQSGVFIPSLKTIEVTELQMKTLRGYSNEIEDAKNLRNSLQARLSRMMDNLKTYNNVTESLPELKFYLDEEIKKMGDEVTIAKKPFKELINKAMIENLRKELSNDNK